MINTISTNATNAVSTNSDAKKLRYKTDSYTLHTFLLVITYYSQSLSFVIITQNIGENKNVLVQ